MRDPKVLEEVKQTLAVLVERSPGRAIEVRIPPYAAVQCGAGQSERLLIVPEALPLHLMNTSLMLP